MSNSSGEVDPEPSYLGAWLTSSTNQAIALGFAVLGVGLSFPLAWLGAELAAVGFLAAEIITSIYIPSIASFRAKVDRDEKSKRRTKIAQDLSHEIECRVEESNEGTMRWQVYTHMQERIAFLHKIARNRDMRLNESDMDRMEDACLDFLGLWLADLSIADRARTVDKRDIEQRMKSIDAQLAEQTNQSDISNLRKARVDLEEILKRRARLGARKAAVEAKLLSIPDTLEEIYHAVITAPTAGFQADRLQDAINRLQVEEELESALSSELGETPLPSKTMSVRAQTRAAVPLATVQH